MDNHRSISLLIPLCQMIALYIRLCLETPNEEVISTTQYRLRAPRSTSEPLCCLRRVITYVARRQGAGILRFRDWGKTDDRMYGEKIYEALRRFGFPEKLVRLLQALYARAAIYVELYHEVSGTRAQMRDMRQRCPLSPYLFVITLSDSIRCRGGSGGAISGVSMLAHGRTVFVVRMWVTSLANSDALSPTRRLHIGRACRQVRVGP